MKLDFPLLSTCDPTSCSGGKIMLCDRLIENVYRKHLSTFNITNSQFVILMVLAKTGGISQVEISNKLSLEKSSVSRNIRRLIATNLAQKSTGKKIEITLSGKKLMEGLIPAWEAAKAEVNTILGEDGQKALNLLIQKLKS